MKSIEFRILEILEGYREPIPSLKLILFYKNSYGNQYKNTESIRQTLYAELRNMEDKGLIKYVGLRNRKYYLTPNGNVEYFKLRDKLKKQLKEVLI